MPRKTLIFPMRMHKEHAFGHLSGYTPAFWMFAQKRGREGNNCFVYLSTKYCHQPGENCSDGYIYHDGRLEWYFEIDEARSSFGGKDLKGIVEADLDRFVPPFRRYDDHKYWFLLRNLRRLNRRSEYEAVYENHQKVLNPNRFWYISKDGDKKPIGSSALRSLEGAPYVGYTTVGPPQADHIDTLYDPYRDLIREAVFRRGGLDEQAIEESFLLVILDKGYEGMNVKKVVQQEGFTDAAAEKYRYDMAFWTEDDTCYAVEFKKGFGEDAPLQLHNYVNYVRERYTLKEKGGLVSVVVCAEMTECLKAEMDKHFKDRRRIVIFDPRISFHTEFQFG